MVPTRQPLQVTSATAARTLDSSTLAVLAVTSDSITRLFTARGRRGKRVYQGERASLLNKACVWVSVSMSAHASCILVRSTPMTVTMLLNNVCRAAELLAGS